MTDTSASRPVQSNHSSTGSTPAPDRRAVEPPARIARNPLRSSRTSALWIGVILFAIALVFLLIFILQNTQSVRITYFTASGNISLAVALLFAVVGGVLLTAIAGSLRIWQLRRRMPHTGLH